MIQGIFLSLSRWMICRKKQPFTWRSLYSSKVVACTAIFGLRTTNYLRDNSDVQIPLSENTGKKRGFAYVKVPRHVSDELLKLHGLGFKGKMLVIEKSKTPPKAKNINGVNRNICPQTHISQLGSDPENTLASRPLQRIKNSYRNTVIHKKRRYCTIFRQYT